MNCAHVDDLFLDLLRQMYADKITLVRCYSISRELYSASTLCFSLPSYLSKDGLSSLAEVGYVSLNFTDSARLATLELLDTGRRFLVESVLRGHTVSMAKLTLFAGDILEVIGDGGLKCAPTEEILFEDGFAFSKSRTLTNALLDATERRGRCTVIPSHSSVTGVCRDLCYLGLAASAQADGRLYVTSAGRRALRIAKV